MAMITTRTSMAGEMQPLHLGDGTASMTKIRPSADGHEQAEHVAARVDDVADVAAHRALVAGQQVGVLAGHHLFAALGHVGAACDALGLAFLAAQLRPADLLAAPPGFGGGHRRGRDRAALAAASLRFGVGLPLGAVVPAIGARTSRRPASVVAVALLTAAASQRLGLLLLAAAAASRLPDYVCR